MTLIFPAVGTPVTRLAALLLEALDNADYDMARIVAHRLQELGGKR